MPNALADKRVRGMADSEAHPTASREHGDG